MGEYEYAQEVQNALDAVGSHRLVPFEVTSVQTDGVCFHLEVVLRYFRDAPVCCEEPGCYVDFLGGKRHDVPGAIGCRLSLPVTPRISMTVHTKHEPGYHHVNLATGALVGLGVDATLTYGEEHFGGEHLRGGGLSPSGAPGE